jgi:carbonic anhydrase
MIQRPRDIRDLLASNRAWAARISEEHPEFFTQLAAQQTPRFLWIGCADSRVPANEIVGMMPGELFVHRNVANLVVHSDLNCLSVIQFAVDVLRVEHIIVCGHYGCSGVRAAIRDDRVGLSDNWLRHVQDVHARHRGRAIDLRADEESAADRLCELNVIEQVVNVCRTTIVQEAWSREQALQVHGWIYGLRDGLLKDLGLSLDNSAALERSYSEAVARFGGMP